MDVDDDYALLNKRRWYEKLQGGTININKKDSFDPWTKGWLAECGTIVPILRSDCLMEKKGYIVKEYQANSRGIYQGPNRH